MTLTAYLKNPRNLTRGELSEINAEIDQINARLDELTEDNCDDSVLVDHYEGRLDALIMILETSEKITKKQEKRAHLRLVQS